MFNRIYSDVGFRCESVWLGLNAYKKEHKIHPILIEDSRRILEDCLRIENKDKYNVFLSSSRDSEVGNIIYEYIIKKRDKNIIEKLKRISSSLGEIQSLDEAHLDEVIAFFEDIVSICKDKSFPVIPSGILNSLNVY